MRSTNNGFYKERQSERWIGRGGAVEDPADGKSGRNRRQSWIVCERDEEEGFYGDTQKKM